MDASEPQADPRQLAYKRIKARRDFYRHIVVYLIINTLLVVLWATTGQGYFWPGWVIAGWGIGVVMNAWDVYGRPISDDDVRRELDRMRHA